MKRFLRLIITGFFFPGNLVFAFAGNAGIAGVASSASYFVIKSNGAGPVTVSLDGRYFDQPSEIFTIPAVYPGEHRLEIYTEKVIYKAGRTEYKRVLLYRGVIRVEPATEIRAVIDRTGNFFIKMVKPLAPAPAPVYQVNYHPANAYAVYAMNPASFGSFLGVLNAQWFDETRLSVAKQALTDNYFTSEQVAEILRTFWFDASRLDFAEAAVARVVDPQNYYLVDREFTFGSSVEALNQYLATCH